MQNHHKCTLAVLQHTVYILQCIPSQSTDVIFIASCVKQKNWISLVTNLVVNDSFKTFKSLYVFTINVCSLSASLFSGVVLKAYFLYLQQEAVYEKINHVRSMIERFHPLLLSLLTTNNQTQNLHSTPVLFQLQFVCLFDSNGMNFKFLHRIQFVIWTHNPNCTSFFLNKKRLLAVSWLINNNCMSQLICLTCFCLFLFIQCFHC